MSPWIGMAILFEKKRQKVEAAFQNTNLPEKASARCHGADYFLSGGYVD